VPERRVAVAIAEGLHARPAALFVKLAGEQPCPVTIRRPEGSPAPAASILSVMTLGARAGDEVVLEADGPDADAALDALAAFLATPEPA
jgi:phosphocarrier protein